MSRELPYALAHPEVRGARELLAAALRGASALLDRLADALAREHAPVHADEPVLVEFYADAGAPEGALYVDGRLVGILDGVRRL